MSTDNRTDHTSDTEKISRQFKPTFVALKNKTTIFILTILLALFGTFSYKKMPRELNPEVVIPYITITTIYPGNSSVDIENLITRPIEKELKNLKGVKNLSSASFQDMSIILLEFETNVPVSEALADTKDQVDKAKNELPSDLDDDPLVDDFDFEEFPVMSINMYGEFSLAELKQYAEDLQEQLESLSEISEADIMGVDEREIQININPHLLESRGVSFQDIEEAVHFENITMGAGEIIVDKTRRSIRTEADYTNMEQIRNTIVKSDDGIIVYLRDVAEVVDGFEELSSVSRLNNQPVVSISVVKKSGANILEAIDNVYKVIDRNKRDGRFPPNLNIVVTDDQSTHIRSQISNLENSIIMGVLLVIIILYLFMGPRNALFSGLAIPMSMFISFITIRWMGYTLNFMVLFALILALGMLVDNAIVVVENVYRLHTMGMNKMVATKKGVSEIAFPIIASTATTLAAFFPLVFWDDIMGEFMKYLPITLIIVLSSSLFVALILNPAFTSSLMKVENMQPAKKHRKLWISVLVFTFLSILFFTGGKVMFGNIMAAIAILIIINNYVMRPAARVFQEKLLPRLEKSYERVLKYSLIKNNAWFFLAGAIALLFMSISFFNIMQPKVLFFPDTDPESIYITMELPMGTDIERSNEISKEIEEIMFNTLEPYKEVVKSINTVVGVGKAEFFSADREPNKSLTTISFIDYEDRQDINTSYVMQELTRSLSDFVGAKIFIEKESMGPPVGNPINIEVAGDDFDQLMMTASEIKLLIEEEKIDGIDQLKFDVNMDNPEMRVDIDRDKVRRFGMSTQQVAYTLRSALYGREVGKYKDGEDDYNIMLRLAPQYRHDVSSLMNQKIYVNGGKKKVPISAVASFEYTTSYDKINRINSQRVVTIYSQVKEGYNSNEINDRIRTALKRYDVPKGFSVSITGEQEEQAETTEFLSQAMLIAVALILLIMITQFNSLVLPLIIIATVLFSTSGVFLGLAIFNMEFIILMTGIGIISLAGIVVNNGIVLVDYIDMLQKKEKEKLSCSPDAFLPSDNMVSLIVEAGKTRLRPVLLTAITTVLGLLPLATGMNFDFLGLFKSYDPNLYFGGPMSAFWSPMAWTVIFGLVFATFLTLIIAPVMYILIVKTKYFFAKVNGKLPKSPSS